MARIAFFTEHLPPDDDPISHFSFDLIQMLAEQGHEIRVYSTYRPGEELPSHHPRIQILRPFKSWSWLEIPRLMPLLLDFQPDVFHIIQPRLEALKGLTNAMTALPPVARLFGKAAVVSSLYDVLERDLKNYRWLLLASDAITVVNDPQRELLEKFLEQNKPPRKPQLITLPITTASPAGDHVDPSLMSETLRVFLDSSHEVIFVPGEISEHRETEALFHVLTAGLITDPRSVVVFGGGWGRIPPHERHELMRIFESAHAGARILVTGPLDAVTERLCLARARVVFLASLAVESLGLTRILRQALGVGAPMIMSVSQAKSDALNWQDEENALIVSDSHFEWTEILKRVLLSDEMIDRIRSQLPEFTRVEALDLPGNAISRIYAEILSSPYSSGPRTRWF